MDASPFPGMDPYLERTWRDVHHSLITYTREALQPRLAPGLRARAEERVALTTPSDPTLPRSFYPDVHIYEKIPPGFLPTVGTAAGGAGEETAGGVVVAEPLVMEFADDETPVETVIHLVDTASGGKVVTVIEFLSPANKLPGPARDQYLRKREELVAARVSLVEIDLVRVGERLFPTAAHVAPQTSATAYAACVRRGGLPWRAELYPISLRARLPVLRIPQRRADPDVTLDVQAVLDQAYRLGRYGEDLDYSQPPPGPPLSTADAAWADALLRAAGRRPEPTFVSPTA